MKIEDIDEVDNALLSVMSKIMKIVEQDPTNEDKELINPHAERLCDIYWELSQAEIHISRLMKRMRQG